MLVIGAGIGGVATALALEQAGLDPQIFEQVPRLVELGAGIGMHANAMRVLNRLGAGDFIREHGVRIDSGEWRRLDSGERIFTQEYAGMAAHYGEHYICMYRAGPFLEGLTRRVPPGRIRLDARLVSVEERGTGSSPGSPERRGGVGRRAGGCRRAPLNRPLASLRRGAGALHRVRGVARDYPDRADGARFRAPDRDLARAGRHGITYPIRPTLQTFIGFVPTTEILRGSGLRPATSRICAARSPARPSRSSRSSI